MRSIITSIHDPVGLAATCRRFGLSQPREESYRFDAGTAFGWVVHVRGLTAPIVCDTLRGLVFYDTRDNVHHRYARTMRFILRYYDVHARLRRAGHQGTFRPLPLSAVA